MKFSAMRSAIVIASVIAGSVIPLQAFAQTPIDVFSGGFEGTDYYSTYRTVYTSVDFRIVVVNYAAIVFILGSF